MAEDETPNDKSDKTAAFRAQMDQAAEGIKDVGAVIASFYKSLLANGVPEDVARELTTAYLVATLGKKK